MVMRNQLFLAVLLVNSLALTAAPRAHLVPFGPWLKVHLFVGPDADDVQDMKIRSLNLDGRSREFTVGEPTTLPTKSSSSAALTALMWTFQTQSPAGATRDEPIPLSCSPMDATTLVN
jgi:hypothetical protein